MRITIVLAVLFTLNLNAQNQKKYLPFPTKVLNSLATSYGVDVKVLKAVVNKHNYDDINIISAIPEDGYECLVSNKSTDDGFYIYKNRYALAKGVCLYLQWLNSPHLMIDEDTELIDNGEQFDHVPIPETEDTDDVELYFNIEQGSTSSCKPGTTCDQLNQEEKLLAEISNTKASRHRVQTGIAEYIISELANDSTNINIVKYEINSELNRIETLDKDIQKLDYQLKQLQDTNPESTSLTVR